VLYGVERGKEAARDVGELENEGFEFTVGGVRSQDP
jgi:hypothetical protein